MDDDKKKAPEWVLPKRSHPANMLLDADGQPVPMSPDAVDHAIADIVNRGDIVLAIFRVDDALAVQSFAPPSQEIVNILEQALHGYRRALKGVKGTAQ